MEQSRPSVLIGGGRTAHAYKARAEAAEAERDRYREALERIGVACDNGAEPGNKLAFIRRVTRDALDEERSDG